MHFRRNDMRKKFNQRRKNIRELIKKQSIRYDMVTLLFVYVVNLQKQKN